MATKINTGDIRDLATLECIGWTRHGEPCGACLDGYCHEHYWGADGRYLGPDEDGIEPVYVVVGETRRYRVYAATTENGGVQGLGQGDEYYEAATAAEAAKMAADDWGWDADDWDGGDVIVATDDDGDSFHLHRTETATETCTFSDGSTGKITREHTTYRGVVLDRCDVTGPRGGTSVLWRASARRLHTVATWCSTRDEAARVASGYTG